MGISDLIEENLITKFDSKDIADSFDRTKDEKGENVDIFFTKLLKDKKIWNCMK